MNAMGNENRSTTPQSATFKDFISSGWADRTDVAPPPRAQAPYAARRRELISAMHAGERLIVPAGPAKTRANDTDYPFRAHSAFSYLTGWGSDTVPGSVLVLEPRQTGASAAGAGARGTGVGVGDSSGSAAGAGAGDSSGAGHDAVLYLMPTAGRDSDEFYANPAIGEFWTGPRPSLAHVAADLGIETRNLDELAGVLDATDASTRIVREADPGLTDQVDGRRLLAAELDADASETIDEDGDSVLLRDLSELRLVKDEFEISEMRAAVDATKQGFDDVIADLPQIVAHPRGERLVEGTFYRRARAEGNTVGYDTIAASGPHACTLHWTRNDGPVVPGDLILLDAGIELDSLYTADITRTLPVNGRFTEVQRRVYEAVLEAADAARAVVKPGIVFREVHAAAMAVIARKTAEWGFLPVGAEESLHADLQYHRRYMVHGTSHHLGIDVHDCAQARRELYLDGEVKEGMVFTIEPGLYFQPDDLTVPEEYRGIGVRIEDDVLVTSDGCENLSAGIPRTVDEVEAWLAG
ncbi:MAG: aminopeptidase P family protein [Microbacteriaceae bacterium]|nr:aminopeptidase P family protein [Microbacteriaceae bacterium]